MNLEVTFDTLKNTGNMVIQNGDEFQTLLNQIKAANEQLQSSWKGADAEKYTGAVAEQAQEMAKLAQTIHDSGQFLIEASNKYRATQEANMSGIR